VTAAAPWPGLSDNVALVGLHWGSYYDDYGNLGGGALNPMQYVDYELGGLIVVQGQVF
jgi:hypothetical protein